MSHWISLFQEVTTVPGAEPSVTVTFTPSQLLTWLLIGLIAGALAGALVRGRRMSLFGSLVVGLLGALIGGFLFTFLRITPSPALQAGITLRWIDIIVAFVGAVIVLVLFGGLFGWRRRD